MTTIASATADDLPALLEIYNRSVATSNSNFASRPADIHDRRLWFAQFSSTGPFRLLVARDATTVVGYASSTRYREHEAFRETVEVSVSVHRTRRGQGIGTSLYSSLLGCLAEERVHVALAAIALPNQASVALHRRFGFTDVGICHEYAIKNGRYISSLWMQRLVDPR